MDCWWSWIQCIFALIMYFIIIFWPVLLWGAVIWVIALLIKDNVKKPIEESPVVSSAFKKIHIIGCSIFMTLFIWYHTYIMSSIRAKYPAWYMIAIILLFYLILFHSKKYQRISFLIILCMLMCRFCVALFNTHGYVPYASDAAIRYVWYFSLAILLAWLTYLYLRRRYDIFISQDKSPDLNIL